MSQAIRTRVACGVILSVTSGLMCLAKNCKFRSVEQLRLIRKMLLFGLTDA